MKHIEKKQVNSRGCKVKRCTSCLVDLVNPDNINPCNYRNYNYICRTCDNKREYQMNKVRRKNKKIGDNTYIQDLLTGVRKRAKKRKLDFSLRAKDIKKLMSSHCPILGIKYVLNKPGLEWGLEKNQNNWATSPSIDRIDNTKGYHADNILIVCMMANSIKNQATPDQIKKVATFYEKLYNERGITYGK